MIKIRIIIPILILLLFFLQVGISCEKMDNDVVINQLPEAIEVEGGQVLDIRVEPKSSNYLARGILLDYTIVKAGSLDRSGIILQNKEQYYAGDSCILVLGYMRNDTDEDLHVDLWAEGYDSLEKQVAWSISSGTIIGHVQYYMPKNSSNSFKITLNWAEDVQLIKITGHSYDRMIPSPPESISD